MNDRQEARLSMYQVVHAHLQSSPTIWQSVPAFVAAELAFSEQVDAIQSQAQAQQLPSTGVTADKQRSRREMADMALPVSAAIRAFAAVTSNADLSAQADFSRSAFIYGRDTAAADNADIVHHLATQHAQDLVDYGIDQARLDTLRSAIDAYRTVIASPRQTIVATAAATAQLAEAFSRADAALNSRLDNLLELFRQSEPSFYLQYQSAREIIDSAPDANPNDSVQPDEPAA